MHYDVCVCIKQTTEDGRRRKKIGRIWCKVRHNYKWLNSHLAECERAFANSNWLKRLHLISLAYTAITELILYSNQFSLLPISNCLYMLSPCDGDIPQIIGSHGAMRWPYGDWNVTFSQCARSLESERAKIIWK